MTQARESGPSRATGAAHGTALVETHPQDTGAPRIPHLTAADLETARPLHVLIVKTTSDQVRRRVYLSLTAAETAAQRARARGHAVTLELHSVLPAHQAEGVSVDA